MAVRKRTKKSSKKSKKKSVRRKISKPPAPKSINSSNLSSKLKSPPVKSSRCRTCKNKRWIEVIDEFVMMYKNDSLCDGWNKTNFYYQVLVPDYGYDLSFTAYVTHLKRCCGFML